MSWIALYRNHLSLGRSEDDDGGGEGGGVLAAFEGEAATEEADFAFHDVVVPPTGVGTGG